MTTLEHAYAAWRLENPAEHGWPLDAFRAGWTAASAPHDGHREALVYIAHTWLEDSHGGMKEPPYSLARETALRALSGAAEELDEAPPRAAIPEPPWSPGEMNARRVGWNRFFQGVDREACPFPPARRDLQAEYREGWDAAKAAGPKRSRDMAAEYDDAFGPG